MYNNKTDYVNNETFQGINEEFDSSKRKHVIKPFPCDTNKAKNLWYSAKISVVQNPILQSTLFSRVGKISLIPVKFAISVLILFIYARPRQ